MVEYSQFFQRYLDLCKEKHLEPMSQKAADSWGVQRATISMWAKNGNVPKGDVVANIAKGLNTSTDYLLGVSDTKSSADYWTENINDKIFKIINNSDSQVLNQWTAIVQMLRALQKYTDMASQTETLQLWKSLNEKNRQKAIGYMQALKDLEDEEKENASV